MRRSGLLERLHSVTRILTNKLSAERARDVQDRLCWHIIDSHVPPIRPIGYRSRRPANYLELEADVCLYAICGCHVISITNLLSAKNAGGLVLVDIERSCSWTRKSVLAIVIATAAASCNWTRTEALVGRLTPPILLHVSLRLGFGGGFFFSVEFCWAYGSTETSLWGMRSMKRRHIHCDYLLVIPMERS